MKIIKSKYSADALYDIYDEEYDRVNTKLKRRLNHIKTILLTMAVVIMTVAYIGVVDSIDIKGLNAEVNTVVMLGLFIVCIMIAIAPYLIYIKCENNIVEYYERKGEVLECRLDKYLPYISFIEMGEELLEEISSYENPELVVSNEDITIATRNSGSSNLISKQSFSVKEIMCGVVDINAFINEEGTIDFSICDEIVTEIFNK